MLPKKRSSQKSYLPPRRKWGLGVVVVLDVGLIGAGLWYGLRLVQEQRGLRAIQQAVHPSFISPSVPALSPEGHYILLRHDTHIGTRDWTPTLALHETKTGRTLWQKEKLSVDPECFSESGNHFIGRRWDLGKTRELLTGVYETQTGNCVAEFPSKNVYYSTLSADGRFLAFSHDKDVVVCDAHTKTERFRVAAPSLKNLTISPDGAWVAGIVTLSQGTGPERSSIARVWRVGQKKPVYELPVNTDRTHLRFSEDSNTLFLTGETLGYPLGLYPALQKEQESYNTIGQLVETSMQHFQQVAEEAYERRPVPELGKVGLLGGNAMGVAGSYGASGVLAFSLTEGKPRWVYYAEGYASGSTLTSTKGRAALCTSKQLLVLDEASGKLLHQASLSPETRPRWLHFVEDGAALLGQETTHPILGKSSSPVQRWDLMQYRWDLMQYRWDLMQYRWDLSRTAAAP